MKTNEIFKYKKLNPEKFFKYGFIEKDKTYFYSTSIMNGEFQLNIEIQAPNTIQTGIIELETNEPYTLHLTNETGNFVGQVRKEYEKVLINIVDKCFDTDVFKSQQSKELIKYISEKYDSKLEFLWEKSPDCAIARRSDNKKWYLLMMTIKKDKLGFNSTDLIEVINIRANTENVQNLIQNKNIFPAYHMNKKHWITIILDDSLPLVEIYKLTDKSYELANKKGKK